MKAPFTLVVAFDGSAEARSALHAALAFADALGAGTAVHAASVVDYVSLPGGLTKAPAGAPDLLAMDAETELRVADEIAAAAGRRITTRVLRGPTVSEILKYAHAVGATMILAGTHGRKGVARAVLGSTCESLVRQSEIPVLTVRAAAPKDNAEETGTAG